MELFRVFPSFHGAAQNEPGGALYRPGTGSGRISNPDRYVEIYFADAAEGALAETFGRLSDWHAGMLSRSGLPLVLGTYRLPDDLAVCDLDDPAELGRRRLRPSEVVTGDRKRSQSWAREIFDAKGFGGIRWWSRFDSRWFVIGLWQTDSLELMGEPEVLRIEDARIERTAQTLSRRVVRARTP